MNSRAAAAACALCLGLAAGGATGQPATRSILGRVVDDEGAVVPGAVVRVFAMTTGRIHTRVTDAYGSFRFPELPPGPYRVFAELEGFSIRDAEVDLRFATAATIELRLTVQSIKETITVTSSESTRLSTPTWNSWLEVRGAGGEPVERLEPNGRYDFRVDLAPLAYRLAGVFSAEAGQGLVEELERALAAGRTVITAQVRPVLVGRSVRLLGDRVQAEVWRRGAWTAVPGDGMVPMDIRLANLTANGDDPPPMSGHGWREAADLARAGGLRFPVEAVEPGCAAITLSIWDESGRLPLDHVVHTVAVGRADCRPSGDGAALRAGLLTLLHETAGTAPHAALHLFEVATASAETHTVAVYVPDQPADGCTHYTWVRPASLSRFLFEQRGFRGTLRRVWAAQGGARYPDLARQLRRVLFPPRDDGGCGGWAVLGSLHRLASQPERSLYARVVDPYNRSHFVPLRLLFALEDDAAPPDTAASAVFAVPPALHQPLPVESYGEARPCVGQWSFLLPPKLQGHDPEIEPPPGTAGPALLTDLEGFRGLVGRRWGAEPDPNEPALGLVILAHHVDGALSTDDPDDPWLWTELEGARFPTGSVALLSACAAGDPTRSLDLVNALARAGFDTVILSPFDVHTPFGIGLATSFARLVTEAQAAGEPARISDLFAAALAETAAALESELNDRAAGMALEFLLAGHGDLRLCGAPSRPPDAGSGPPRTQAREHRRQETGDQPRARAL